MMNVQIPYVNQIRGLRMINNLTTQTNCDYIIVPKNSGLARAKDLASGFNYKEIIEVRGEDVPLFVDSLLAQGKNVLGITGEDLFKEFLLSNKNSNVNIIRTIAWEDSNCLFGKPTLCLMGNKETKLADLPKQLRVCINQKYTRIAKKYLARLEDGGFRFKKFYLSGATESTFTNNFSDLVIDIVYSGKSVSEAGLAIYDKIFSSDIAIIGGKNGI